MITISGSKYIGCQFCKEQKEALEIFSQLDKNPIYTHSVKLVDFSENSVCKMLNFMQVMLALANFDVNNTIIGHLY